MNFTERLIKWYRENKRDLPFRDQKDPYKIWVSEIMAQQTQIATMIPYFNRWIDRFPTIEVLANSKIEDVLKMWEGLGYYRRARNLHAGACFVMEHFNGQLPKTKIELMTIPGIGDYTSSAIASIAFEEPEIVIDGNVKRVMARFLNYTENVNARAAHKVFDAFLKNELLKNGANPNEFNQALMELGALVCTPQNTQCEGCPFEELCACWRGECIGTVPFVPKAKKVPSYDKTAFVVVKDNKILISDDHSDGLMEGLYRLPQRPEHTLINKVDVEIVHKFSHLHWNIKAYISESIDFDTEHCFFVDIQDLKEKYALVTAHKKILSKLNIL